MPWGAAIGAIGAIAGGVMQGDAAKSAANTQANAALQAAQISAQQRAPWVQAGTEGLGLLRMGLQPGGQFQQKFDPSQAMNAPAEQAALQQGLAAINNSNAAKSGTLNTNALAQATQFAEGTAAQYENQAFNQFWAQQQNLLSPIEAMAQTGFSAASQTADTTANMMVGAGNAQAAGIIGQGNAYSNMASQLGNIGSGVNWNKIFGGTNTPTTDTYSNQFGQTGDAASYGGDPYASPGEYDSNMQYSDERLKKNIKHVGYTKGGMPIYTYKMKDGGPTQMGVMAQDIEDVEPRAVKKDRQGFRMVDYDKVK